MTTRLYSQGDNGEIEALLLGHRVTSATNDTLTLDDGTVLEVTGNEGCACAYGNYDISALNTFDNIITKVELVEDMAEDYSNEYGDVHLFVYAEGGNSVELIHAEGVDSGYYGTGFSIVVKKPL